MPTQTLKEHAEEHGAGQKTPDGSDAILLEKSNGEPAYCTVTALRQTVGFADLSGTPAQNDALATALADKVDSAGAEAAAEAFLTGLPGTQDATTALLGNLEWGAVNPAQVSGGEITAGTETALRSYSPADVKSFVTQHGGGGGGLTLTDDSNASVTIGNALTGTHRRLTHATPALTLDAQASVGTLVAATPAGGTTASVAVEAGATYFVQAADQSAAGATTGFNLKGFTVFECQANADGNSAKWFVAGDTDLDETADGDLTVAGALDVTGAADLNGTVNIGNTLTLDGSATLDAGGKLVHSNLASVVTGVSGTLSTTAHMGRLVVTSGNITVPTTAGFHCLVKAGGAHTISFNSTTTAAATSGQACSVFVQSATVVIITPWTTPQTLT